MRAQSCLILCNPMDCSPPGSSVYGIFQAGMLKWVAISFSFYCRVAFYCVCVCVCVCVYTHHIFFIHLSIDGHLACFQILVVIDSAAMDIGVHVSFQIGGFIVFRYIPRSGIAGSYGSSIFNFFAKPPYCFSSCLHQFAFSPTVFSTSSPTFVICVLFDDNHSDRCEVTAYCSFDLCFPDD